MMMISKASNSCCSASCGENLGNSLIHFEEGISSSLSSIEVYSVSASNPVANQDIKLKGHNISPCKCIDDDIMRHYKNIQHNNSWFHSLSHKIHYSHLTTRRKLLFLVFVASLALLSIIFISEQLIVRHIGRQLHTANEFYDKSEISINPYSQFEMYEEFDILTLEEWAHQETIDFDDKVITVQEEQDKVTASPIPGRHPDFKLTTTAKPLGISKIVEDGIFWSSELEAAVPPGPTDQGVLIQMQELRDRKVRKLEPPNWLHCGREKNRFIEFADGSNACARYRGPDHAEFVQGELMAFYLARLLGITNTPAVVLSETSSQQWQMLESSERRNWTNLDEGSAVVALIEWLPDLTKATMPYLLLNKLQANDSLPVPIDGQTLERLALNKEEGLDEDLLTELVQWSDLIVFDYLTGNYDRVASMQDGADKENRPAVLHETIHNLAKSTETGSLWLLDNESAFLDAYLLLYATESEAEQNGKRFQKFHQQMLETTCIFRRNTVNRLYALHKSADPAKLLLRFVSDNEPLFKTRLPTIHHNSPFNQHFVKRIEQLWQWIRRCQLKVNHY